MRLLDALGIDDRVTLVVHDWGSALGFDWANRHRERRRRDRLHGSHRAPAHAGTSGQTRREPSSEGLRSAAGEAMILDKNVFVERVLPGSIMRTLTRCRDGRVPPAVRRGRRRSPPDADVATTDPDRRRTGRRHRDRRRPTPTGCRPVTCPSCSWSPNPERSCAVRQLEFCRRWPNQREVTVAGNHFLQEDSPDEIGLAIATWIRERTDR